LRTYDLVEKMFTAIDLKLRLWSRPVRDNKDELNRIKASWACHLSYMELARHMVTKIELITMRKKDDYNRSLTASKEYDRLHRFRNTLCHYMNQYEVAAIPGELADLPDNIRYSNKSPGMLMLECLGFPDISQRPLMITYGSMVSQSRPRS